MVVTGSGVVAATWGIATVGPEGRQEVDCAKALLI